MLARALSLLPLAVVFACSVSDEPRSFSIGVTRESIIGGTTDTTHDAVVALVNYDKTSGNSATCSGTVVKVQNGIGYVLTAAHCCNTAVKPTLVVAAQDYAPYVPDLAFAHVKEPAYLIVPASIKWDPAYSGSSHDLCMLQFWNAPATMPTIPISTSTSLPSSLEFVGYGATQAGGGGNNTKRFKITGSTSAANSTTDYVHYTQTSGGPCVGDSGGPSLSPPGVPQAQQTVFAVISTGDNTCTQYGRSSRVASAANGFIADYYANTPPTPKEPGTTCDKCWDRELSVGGECRSSVTECEDEPDCTDYAKCFDDCSSFDKKCQTACRNDHAKGAALYDAIQTCVCTDACNTECKSACPVPAAPDAGKDASEPSGPVEPGTEDPAEEVDAAPSPAANPSVIRTTTSGCGVTPAAPATRARDNAENTAKTAGAGAFILLAFAFRRRAASRGASKRR